jgi:two-component system, NarL family, nitrate/nitrite response regulator NarL
MWYPFMSDEELLPGVDWSLVRRLYVVEKEPMRILLVEDHLLIQQAMAHLLSAQPDITVVGGARTVQEAVSQSRRHNPDCILMDFSLPDGTGLEAAQAILAEQPHIKIVFLTIHEDEDKIFDAIRHGAQGYLPKHINSAQLLEYLRALKQGDYAIQPQYLKRIIDKFAHSPSPKAAPQEDASDLTPRELEVLQELKTGASNREIAARLVISEQTVKNHVSRILKKRNIKSRHEIAAVRSSL